MLTIFFFLFYHNYLRHSLVILSYYACALAHYQIITLANYFLSTPINTAALAGTVTLIPLAVTAALAARVK